VEWKEGWKLSRRLSVDITVESAWYGTRERETGKGYRETGIRKDEEAREEGTEATRKKCGIRDFVCLPVRPSEPEGTSAAANLEEELGRETNTSAEKRR